MPLPQMAGILSNDMAFRRFVAAERGLGDTPISVEAAAEHIRQTCGVTSRKDLSTNPNAARKFLALRTDFDAWRGVIPQQR